jgi:hypothetical protein
MKDPTTHFLTKLLLGDIKSLQLNHMNHTSQFAQPTPFIQLDSHKFLNIILGLEVPNCRSNY